MGLTGTVTAGLARLGSRRLHVLVVGTPGAFNARVEVERACVARGWQLSLTPAGSDALLVCGAASDPAFADAVEQVWGQLPGPRVRGVVDDVGSVHAALDSLAMAYRRWTPSLDGPRGDPHGHEAGASEDPDDAGSSDADGGMDMDADGGMEMDMSGPGGIALASGAEDRDGLEMDVLHLRLGPVLPCWPSALAVDCVLHGDVVSEVEVHTAAMTSASGVVAPVALQLDAVVQLLSLAGAEDLASDARVIRNRCLDGDDSGVAGLRRRIGRSRLLRWSLRGVGPIGHTAAAEHDWPAAWIGDANDRLGRLLESSTCSWSNRHVAAALPLLLPGVELATARLIVASLLGHPDRTDPVLAGSRSGRIG